MTTLFSPLRLGALDLPNRIVMAPLTRARATRAHVPTAIMAEYYRQRASAGMIVSEAIGISRQGLGWPGAAGLWSKEQVDGWRGVTRAVHEAGGRIVAQLWHMGRTVHPDYIGGAAPLSASATTAPGRAYTYSGKKPYAAARAADADDIARTINEFAAAAANAVAAGFDGVQVHAGNGYLIDQFLRDSTNRREDQYGGDLVGRLRLLDDVVRSVAAVAGCDRTSVRISPNGDSQGVNDSNPESLFVAAATMLRPHDLAFLDIREPGFDGTFGKADRPPIAPAIKAAFGGPVILNSDYDPVRAERAVASGAADAIAFGRPFVANPDLVDRIARGTPLAGPDPQTWYAGGADGYIDYPPAPSNPERSITA